jgi:hypothetical protein
MIFNRKEKSIKITVKKGENTVTIEVPASIHKDNSHTIDRMADLALSIRDRIA